ncbi:MAG TPA: ATP-binding protein, partial [Kofleriaceae bacterium]|nr:ATP-binding protein [Kofleriaceae bacterium]
ALPILIDDLLTLSRVTRSELRRDRVDLSALAHTLVAALQRSEPARHVEIVIAPGIVADADPQLTAIALDNLLGNAWKFTSKRADARIEVGVTSAGGVPAYFVRDNGAGFDMAYRDKLFGVFQRLHPESEYPGTGIGLATVARIAHRHRGRVWADGKPGEGATFYFTLQEPHA